MKRFALFTFAILFLFACKKDPLEAEGALAHVPATASTVSSVNLQRLMEKADFEAVKQMGFYQKMLSETRTDNPAIAAALENPAASGIDLTKRIFMATEMMEDNPEEMVTHVLVSLKSASDFEKIVRDGDLEIKENNGRKTVVTNDARQIMTWNDQLLVFSFANGDASRLAEKVAALFDLKPEASIAQNDNFRKAMESEHDMVNWLSTNAIADNPAAGAALNLIDLDKDLLRDNFIHSYGDFENGRMVGHSDFHVNSKLGRGLLGRFFNKEVKTDFSKVLPAGQLAFATTVAFDLSGIDQFLSERPQSQQYVDFVANDMAGFSRQELLEVLNGDILVANIVGEGGPEQNFVVALGAKSQKAGQALIDKAIADKKLKEIEPGYYNILGFGGEEFSIRVNKGIGKLLFKDGVFVYSPNEAALEQIRFGKTGTELPQSFDNQTIAGWFDMQSAQGYLGTKNANWFKEMRFNVNGSGADFIMQTNDPNTNALKSMFQMMDEAYEKQKTAVEGEGEAM